MAGEWQMDSLEDLIDVKHGFAFKGDFIHDEPHGDVLFTPGNFAIGGGFKGDKFKYYEGFVPDEFVLQEGDLLVTMTDLSKQADTLGYPAFVPASRDGRRYLHNQRLGKVLFKDPTTVDARYLYYVMCGQEYRHEVLASATGTTVKHTSPERIRRFRFLRAPFEEQRAIAHILSTLDDKIELNRRMNETLEAMARAIFKSWFVDFDPVRAKHAMSKVEGADGRPSTSSGQATPSLPQPLADLFPARLVDSELGEIPEGWEVESIAHLTSLNPETWSKDTRPDVINYVDLSNTKWGRIETITAYAQQDAPSRAQRVLRPRDTIIGTVRPGNGSYAFISENGFTGSTGFAVLRPLSVEYAEFVYLAATAAENIEALAHLADGGAYPAVRPEVVAATPVVRPDDKALSRFSRTADPLLAKMAHNIRESRNLAALRDALLPKLISGELRVMNRERFVGAQP